MPDPIPDNQLYDQFIQAQDRALRANDRPPENRKEWDRRRDALRQAVLAALGPAPAAPGPLEPKALGALKRAGYRIEKVAFQSRPDVWVTANAYVPDAAGKRPAVLVVHGHWAGARRD